MNGINKSAEIGREKLTRVWTLDMGVDLCVGFLILQN